MKTPRITIPANEQVIAGQRCVMMNKNITYPFTPKSTSKMVEGQFWPIQRTDGTFACGRVMGFEHKNGKKDSRRFIAALMDWVGPNPPNERSIQGARIAYQGVAHLLTITKFYGEITGFRNLDDDGLRPLQWTEHRQNDDWGLYECGKLIRILAEEEASHYPRRKAWGYNVINLFADSKLTTQQYSRTEPRVRGPVD